MRNSFNSGRSRGERRDKPHEYTSSMLMENSKAMHYYYLNIEHLLYILSKESLLFVL